ncbi:uncharacterized protein LOC121377549 isoform X2 [Gigantopelta aegis]|nr:uncharacterized protein LOC121377549 isoform X2 [Gigantopelta aegis]
MLQESDKKMMYVIPSYVNVLWNSGQFNTCLYDKVHLALYTWIFLPVNINGNHWVLLAANVQSRSVCVLDSMAGENSAVINNWKTFMEIRAAVVGELKEEWQEGTLTSASQSDSSSCGPFVLLNALALVRGVNPKSLDTSAAHKMRSYVFTKLLNASTMLNNM